MTTKKVCLNVWRNSHAIVTAVQGEVSSRFVEISLHNNNQPLDLTDKTVAIYMTKPDKTIIYNNCEILDEKKGLIMVALTSQMSAVAGTICDCEVHVIGEDASLLKILGLTIIIDHSLEDTKAIESSNELTLLLEALKKADNILDVVTETLQQKLSEFDNAFADQIERIHVQISEILSDADVKLSCKLQDVDTHLNTANQQLQKVITNSRQSVQAAVADANSAANRANDAVNQMEQVAEELVTGAIEEEKNKPNGIAGLNSLGKLTNMPTAGDVGAVPTSRTVNGYALTTDIMLDAANIGAVPLTRTINNKNLEHNITLTANDVSAVSKTEVNQPNGVAGLNSAGKLANMPTTTDIGVDSIFLASHPVGSLYFTTVDINPGTLFGGTWVAWGSGRVPVGVNTADTDFTTVEKTGGEKTHTLTKNEIPSHVHNIQKTAMYGEGNTGWNFAPNSDGDWKGYHKDTDATGGGQAHNNLQPYITCYMWKRIT